MYLQFNFQKCLKNNFSRPYGLELFFQARFISPPPPIKKETEGRKEKAEPPDANPRHFTERRLARRSGVKSDLGF